MVEFSDGFSDGFSPLVSVDWLARHLTAPDLVVLDCTASVHPLPQGGMRAESGRAAYEAAHIPGAGFADLVDDLSDPNSALRFTLPAPEAFAMTMGQLGVSDDSHVVLYAAHPHWAARVWWMLRHFGFDRAALLDGGLSAWQAAGHPVESGASPVPRAASLSIAEERGLFCGADETAKAASAEDGLAINALSREQHEGTGGPHYGRPGRIPGSVCLPARALTNPDGTFRPLDDLRAEFDAIGALDGKTIVTYCGGGIAACGDAFVLHLLGQDNVQVYDASLQEWARSNRPMEAQTPPI